MHWGRAERPTLLCALDAGATSHKALINVKLISISVQIKALFKTKAPQRGTQATFKPQLVL